jgi:hypothetical protein
MVSGPKRGLRLVVGVFIAVMIMAAIYKLAWLLLGAMTSGIKPRSLFDVANLLEGPAYLIAVLAAWRRPWIAEAVAVLTLIVILSSFSPLTTGPVQRGFFVDYVFIVSANVVFFSSMTVRNRENYGS